MVFLENGFFERFLQFRIDNPQYLLVFPNIINNAICTYIQSTRGTINAQAALQPWCMDDVAWRNGRFAEQLHRAFLRSIASDTIDRWYFDPTPLAFCRFSINCMAWFGKDFKLFDGKVEKYEEEDLTVLRPASLSRDNCICGNAIIAHYSYYPQKEYLDSTDILTRYEDVAANRQDLLGPRYKQIPTPDLWTHRLLDAIDAIDKSSFADLGRIDYVAGLIRRAGLQFDPRNPYGADNIYMNTGWRDTGGQLHITTGLWQLPVQLARLLIRLSDISISRMIEIGTGAGWTTCVITAYLKRFNPALEVTTVDTLNLFKSYPIIQAILPICYWPGKSSSDFADQQFDLAFIDGDHTYAGCRADYRAVGENARICVFHDINDKYVLREPKNEGGGTAIVA